ncbi:unnamed protein product, partial [Hapterophycus canaliculatus]
GNLGRLLHIASTRQSQQPSVHSAGLVGLEPNYMIVGEPTGSKMMRLQKGMLKVRLSCRGVACHR